jgi:hypothetical protein
LISSARRLGGAEHRASAWLLPRERCPAPARARR